MDQEIQRSGELGQFHCLKLTKSFLSSLLAAAAAEKMLPTTWAIRLTARNHYEVAPASTIYSFRTVSPERSVYRSGMSEK